MITYSKIGHFGRLGNQLFQFASTVGIARKLGYEVAFPKNNTVQAVTEHFHDGVTRDVVFDIPAVFNVPESLLYETFTPKYLASERFFHFDNTLFGISDNTDLAGYMQSEKYFKHCEEELRSILTFKEAIQQVAIELFPKVDHPTVSIHVRRGDYVNQQQFHPVCSLEYYQEALNIFTDQNYTFIVFSDDVEYCREIFGSSDNLLYIDNRDPYIDLCLMSMCDNNIIANSSFSWWGAWLTKNKQKKVVAPKHWFGSAYSHNTSDLYCENWAAL
jgi:hypothetical protein